MSENDRRDFYILLADKIKCNNVIVKHNIIIDILDKGIEEIELVLSK